MDDLVYLVPSQVRGHKISRLVSSGRVVLLVQNKSVGRLKMTARQHKTNSVTKMPILIGAASTLGLGYSCHFPSIRYVPEGPKLIMANLQSYLFEIKNCNHTWDFPLFLT